MIENDISSILLDILIFGGFIFALINMWNYRKFKELKIENELLKLKLKLKDCEQHRA